MSSQETTRIPGPGPRPKVPSFNYQTTSVQPTLRPPVHLPGTVVSVVPRRCYPVGPLRRSHSSPSVCIQSAASPSSIRMPPGVLRVLVACVGHGLCFQSRAFVARMHMATNALQRSRWYAGTPLVMFCVPQLDAGIARSLQSLRSTFHAKSGVSRAEQTDSLKSCLSTTSNVRLDSRWVA